MFDDYILPFQIGDANGAFGKHPLSPDDVAVIQELRNMLEGAHNDEVKKILVDDINNFLFMRFYYYSGSSD